jgi:hypothetical protein
MIQVLGLQKEAGSDPPVFTLYLKDEENDRKGYMWSTETGTEEVLRGALAKGGMPEPKIDVLFAHAAELGVKENRSGEQI